jgi:uncharacterized protein
VVSDTVETIDLDALGLTVGEGRRLEPVVALAPLEFGGERYLPEPEPCPLQLEVSRINGDGWALHLAFTTTLRGRCMRCLEPAGAEMAIDSREACQRNAEGGVESPYVEEGELDVGAWARDALALAVPAQVLCREGCLGLCPRCGENLNEDPGHEHPAEKDPRWSKLDELRFD